MEIKKIVLTGGPCAGKTTALSWVTNNFEKSGWKVVVVNEAATELILAGMNPGEFYDSDDFQEMLLRTQIFKEDSMEEFIQRTNQDKFGNRALIVCDRGIGDNRAYVQDTRYPGLLQRVGLTPQKAFERYDAVFHLVTAADGAEEAYTLSNNGARTETIEQARELDRKTQNAWVGHPHLRVIRNEKDSSFKQKLQKLMLEISLVLGSPEPLEIERKFLIKFSDVEKLVRYSCCQKVDILQTYLLSGPNEEVRVRQRGMLWDYTFTKTVKRKTGNPAERVEVETRITNEEYLKLLMDADPKMRPIRKTRFCFLQRMNGQYFEFDIYPDNQKYAIMEVELSSKNERVLIPNFVDVVREVTDDPSFSNYEIAKNGGNLPKV